MRKFNKEFTICFVVRKAFDLNKQRTSVRNPQTIYGVPAVIVKAIKDFITRWRNSLIFRGLR